jgi:hypothetical protein
MWELIKVVSLLTLGYLISQYHLIGVLYLQQHSLSWKIKFKILGWVLVILASFLLLFYYPIRRIVDSVLDRESANGHPPGMDRSRKFIRRGSFS